MSDEEQKIPNSNSVETDLTSASVASNLDTNSQPGNVSAQPATSSARPFEEPPTLQLEVPHGTFAPGPDLQAAGPTTTEPSTNSSSLEDKVKKGAKGYLRKIGKLMMFFAILGSLFLCFAAYMISSTLNNIISKIEQVR